MHFTVGDYALIVSRIDKGKIYFLNEIIKSYPRILHVGPKRYLDPRVQWKRHMPDDPQADLVLLDGNQFPAQLPTHIPLVLVMDIRKKMDVFAFERLNRKADVVYLIYKKLGSNVPILHQTKGDPHVPEATPTQRSHGPRLHRTNESR